MQTRIRFVAEAMIGRGSEVLGFDDAMSRDHDFVEGRRVHFATDAEVHAFAIDHLGLIPGDDPIDWLLLTGQSVLEITAGPVFRDDLGSLTALREKLRWYPPAVEAYVVASAWRRIDQELPFIGRTRDRGDELGSRVLAARVARGAMHLTFLLQRRWPPYPKWFGTALGAQPVLDTEAALCEYLDALTERPVTAPFHDRPYRCIDPAFIASLVVDDPVLSRLPIGIGSVEQWCDNVDVLSYPARRVALRRAYESWLE